MVTNIPDDMFKCIFLDENILISIKILLKFVPKGPINNIPTLVKIVDWRRPGDKPLSESVMTRLPTHICITQSQCVKLSLCAKRDATIYTMVTEIILGKVARMNNAIIIDYYYISLSSCYSYSIVERCQKIIFNTFALDSPYDVIEHWKHWFRLGIVNRNSTRN